MESACVRSVVYLNFDQIDKRDDDVLEDRLFQRMKFFLSVESSINSSNHSDKSSYRSLGIDLTSKSSRFNLGDSAEPSTEPEQLTSLDEPGTAKDTELSNVQSAVILKKIWYLHFFPFMRISSLEEFVLTLELLEYRRGVALSRVYLNLWRILLLPRLTESTHSLWIQS